MLFALFTFFLYPLAPLRVYTILCIITFDVIIDIHIKSFFGLSTFVRVSYIVYLYINRRTAIDRRGKDRPVREPSISGSILSYDELRTEFFGQLFFYRICTVYIRFALEGYIDRLSSKRGDFHNRRHQKRSLSFSLLFARKHFFRFMITRAYVRPLVF